MKKSLIAFSVVTSLVLAGCGQSAGPNEQPTPPPAAQSGAKPDQVIATPPPSPNQGTGEPVPVIGNPPPGPTAQPSNPGLPDKGAISGGQVYTIVSGDGIPAPVTAKLGTLKEKGGSGFVIVGEDVYAYISLGTKPSGGYAIDLKSISESGGKVEIQYVAKSPSPGAMVTQALTTPTKVIRFGGQAKANLQVTFKILTQ